ncbi:MAG: dienelactone hydrolase family protein [Truepera sp.]|nr:dienelactone hydrolase family protein [Truepera sp.]
MRREVTVLLKSGRLSGSLALPPGATGLVLFAHGSGSSRHSPRNRFVAERLNSERLATLLIDLLHPAEDRGDPQARFDIPLLAERLLAVMDWLQPQPDIRPLPLGLFGASTGAAAALDAAAQSDEIKAVVSRGGRPDLAADLTAVRAPTLLIVGAADPVVLELNRAALAAMRCEKALTVIPGAGHLFEEQGALEQVAALASDWFRQHLALPPHQSRGTSR